MTAAPNGPLLDRVALAIRNAAEHPSDIRSGTIWFVSGKCKEPFEESDYLRLADNALAACHAEEMRAALKLSLSVIESACDQLGIDHNADDFVIRVRALLAEVDATSSEDRP